MSRMKIDYGIDLGTTNSSVARMENGTPVIKKTDTLKDTMPSCVGFNKKKSTLVGDAAWNHLKSDKSRAMKSWGVGDSNTFIEFKRTMGTDKMFRSAYMGREYDSEQLSCEVLKKIRSFVKDEEFAAAVITVPAKFDIRQKDATKRAARLAGFQQAELLQEPIAASMAYSLDSDEKNGYWAVFDFGGGTFDVSLVKLEDGIMKVFDTDGDNYLGGKNLDSAIIDEIIVPYLERNYSIQNILGDVAKKQILQDAMKYYAEEAKIQLSFNDEYNILSDLGDIPGEDDRGKEFELDITVNKEELSAAIAPVFQRAIDITKGLMQRNNLSGDDLDALILVGGPTYSPVLRSMLENQIKKPDTSADPMTAVAKGAALYAADVDLAEEIREASRDKSKIQLDIGYDASTVEEEELVSVKVLPEKSEGDIPEEIYVEIARNDKAWSSGRTALNKAGEVISVRLVEDKPNRFDLVLYDGAGNRVEVQPDNFTIIHGAKVGSATLPYHIGIEIEDREDGKLVFEPVMGLEMNKSLPATGTINGLKTQKQIRPGNPKDMIKIPIYQGDYHAVGTRAMYNEHVYDARITGDDLPGLLPEGSDVDVTLLTDKSGRIEKIEAFFPYLEYTAVIDIPEDVMSEIDAHYLDDEISKAERSLEELSSDDPANQAEIESVKAEVDKTKKDLTHGRGDYDRKKEIQENLRKSLKKIDRLNESEKWPQFQEKLEEAMVRLENADMHIGKGKNADHIRKLRSQMDEVIRDKDIKTGHALHEEMEGLFVAITLIHQLIGFIRHCEKEFSSIKWRNPRRVRELIQQAKHVIENNPTEEGLHPLVLEIQKEFPHENRGESGPTDDEVLRK